MTNTTIALFCLVHPATEAKQQRLLDLLQKNAREYYTKPEAKCSTWSYFTPFPPPKPSSDSPPVIAGLEIYSDKKALQAQVDDEVYFQPYHAKVKREGLYAGPEELVAWYPAALGFVARKGREEGGGGVLVSVTRMVTDDLARVFGVMRPFAEWVEANEPDVLSYMAFTRRKAPGEVLLVVRYKDVRALRGHNEAEEHRVVVEKLRGLVQGTIADTTTLWREVEGSFVSTVVGGKTS